MRHDFKLNKNEVFKVRTIFARRLAMHMDYGDNMMDYALLTGLLPGYWAVFIFLRILKKVLNFKETKRILVMLQVGTI